MHSSQPEGGPPAVQVGPADLLEEALAAPAREAVRPTLGAAAVAYAAATLALPVMVEGRLPGWLWGSALSMTAVCWLAWWGVRDRRASAGAARGILAGVGALFVAHTLLVIGVTAEMDSSGFLVLVVAGAGFILLSLPYLAGLYAFSAAAWVVANTLLIHEPVQDSVVGSSLVTAMMVGAIAHVMRTRAVVAAAADARARRRQEEALVGHEARFRAISDHAPEAILCADARGRITYANPAALELFGMAAAPGVPLSDLLGPDGDPAKLAQHAKAHAPWDATGRAVGDVNARLEVTIAAWDESTGPAYALHLRDVTARRAAEAAERAAVAEDAELQSLRRMNAMKTQLLNTAAHELNTPITPIRLQLHMLRSGALGALSPRQSRAADIVDRNVGRLSVLVQEILDVARLESGRLKLDRKPVDLRGVLEETRDSFDEAARELGVQLKVDMPDGLVVLADRNRVVQVLFNLVTNALKFTPAGGTIQVTGLLSDAGATVSVTDTGIGLEPEQIGRLFQPFSQVHDPMKLAAHGTGLGLYICRGIIESHGGRIEVHSPGSGHGSTFSFTLPVTSGEPSPVVAIPTQRPAPRAGTPDAMDRRLRELI